MKVLSYIVILMIAAYTGNAQSISVTGNWTASVSATVATEAGPGTITVQDIILKAQQIKPI